MATKVLKLCLRTFLFEENMLIAYFTAIENIDVFNVHSNRKMLIGLAKVSEIV